MITVKCLIEEYGDLPLNQDALRLFGIVEPEEVDRMLRISDVELLLASKKGSATIKRLKGKYRLNYDESSIPASIFAEEYGMKKEHIINFLDKQQKLALLEQDQKQINKI